MSGSTPCGSFYKLHEDMFLSKGEKAARSSRGQSGAHQPLGTHWVPGLMPRLSARESQRNYWMHYDLFGLGNAERMADIEKMPDCSVAAGSLFRIHSFFMDSKISVS